MSARRSAREEELLKEGWSKQFCASGPRVQEASELYESMGLEVRLEPATVEDMGCAECLQGPSGTFGDCYVIYTRPKGDEEDPKLSAARKREEELW